MKKRILAGLLCLVMLVSTLVTLCACGENPKNNTTTTAAGGTDTPKTDDTTGVTKPTLPSFGSEDNLVEINFAIAETDADGFHKRSIKDEDADLDDPVDAAINTRNKKIEEELGVEIVLLYYTTEGLRNTSVRDSLLAHDDTYDVIGGRQFDDCQLCLDNVLADLSNLYDDEGNAIDYLHTDQAYWSSYYIDAMKCGNAIYWLTGNICLRYSGGFYCFFVNNELYEETLASTYGSIYQVVKDGKWTYDTLLKMVEMSFQNLDGDESVVSTEDQLGLALPVWDNINGMSIAAGVEYCKRNDDGSMTCTFNETNSTVVDFMSACYNLLNSGYVYNYIGNYQQALTDFTSNAVFASARLNQAELYLQDMESYSIIPCPKLSETADYRASVHDGVQLYGINVASSKIPAAAATLELMAYYSYVDVRPKYYDSALKYLYSRNEGAAEMIDLMDTHVYSDFVYIWQFCSQFNDLGGFLRNNVTGKKATQMLKRVSAKYATGLETVMEEIKSLEE